MEQQNLKGEVVCNLIFSAAAFKRRHYTDIFQRDFYNIVIIRFSLFIYEDITKRQNSLLLRVSCSRTLIYL